MEDGKKNYPSSDSPFREIASFVIRLVILETVLSNYSPVTWALFNLSETLCLGLKQVPQC